MHAIYTQKIIILFKMFKIAPMLKIVRAPYFSCDFSHKETEV